jgi:tetratricopeptide (TPR) repeat protein
MIKKNLLLISIFLIFLIIPNFGNAGFRDELPNLKTLSDYAIGERRVIKAYRYEARGKFKKANKLYSQALDYFLLANEKTPASSAIYFYLGFTSEKLKKISDAEIYYFLGLEIDPGNSKINNYLGQLYIKNNRISEAKERLEILKNCNCEEFEELKTAIKQGSS